MEDKYIMKYIKLFEEFISEGKLNIEKITKATMIRLKDILNEGITSQPNKVASEFRKELKDMKSHFGFRLKNNTIHWDGVKKTMKASEGSEGFEPSKGGIIPMYMYWVSKYRNDKAGKYTKLKQEIEKFGITLSPQSNKRDGRDSFTVTIK